MKLVLLFLATLALASAGLLGVGSDGKDDREMEEEPRDPGEIFYFTLYKPQPCHRHMKKEDKNQSMTNNTRALNLSVNSQQQ